MWAVLEWQAVPSLKRLGVLALLAPPHLRAGLMRGVASRLVRYCCLFALDRPSLHRWCVIAFSQRQVSEFRLLSIGKCATVWLGARSPGADHNHDHERDWGPRTSSIRSISIGWRWVACHRNNTRSILPRFRQPWASGMIRYGMG